MLTFIKKNKPDYFTIFLLFAGINYSFSQNIDSLLNLLKTDKEDTNKATHLNKLSEEYIDIGQYDKGITYAKQVLLLPKSLGVKKRLAKTHNNMGEAYWRQGNYPEALKNHFAALKIFEELKDKKGIANSYSYVGTIYANQRNYVEALKNYNISLKIRQEIKDKRGIAISYNNIGIVYDEQFNYPEALKNYYNSLKIFEEFKDKHSISAAYANIALTYDEQGNITEALKNYLIALRIKEEIGNKDDIISPLNDLAELYIQLNKKQEAQNCLEKALRLSTEIRSKEHLSATYHCLTILDSAMGNYKAGFEHYEMYFKYNDSIYNEKNSQQINELSAKYESEKKEKEIAQLNVEVLTKQKDQEVLNAKIDEKNSIIIAIVTGALFLSLSILLFYSRQQLKQKNIYQAELSKQQEHTAIAIIEAQENERNRIAQDLHDGIGTFLSTLKVNLQSFENVIPTEKLEQYKNTSLLVDKTSVELRNIMKNLSSETLQEQGLEPALHELVESVNRLGNTKINFLSHGITKRLDAIIEINLFRVAQELINNTIKHARATQATLQLIDHENTLLLMIEDNGKGFNAITSTQHKTEGGMGLKNIRNRINFIKGTLKTESVLEKGSTFIIETPKHLA